MKVKEITNQEAERIIDMRIPRGLFYLKDDKTGAYVGIDNITGDAWTEEFETFEDCRNWLLDD